MVSGDRISGVVSRLKREDCKNTKHDREFSKWEILIGPSDWEDYSMGKEGAEKYRVHNLPKNSGPGVYELGIAVSRTGLGRDIWKLDRDRVVVVYLGQADNVRARLQHYGRSGSHLGNSSSTGLSNDCKAVGNRKGPGLFEEVLACGYPIVFRWATMQSKSEALKTEIQLLNTFDYAWNMSINGTRRPDDILRKLKKISSSTTHFSDIARKLAPFSQKQVGIRIKTEFPSAENKPSTCANEESHNLLSRVFKFGRSQPRLVQDRSAPIQESTAICGVVLGYDSVCTRPPVEGRKRCSDHIGMKIKGSISCGISSGNFHPQSTFAGPSSSHDSKDLQSVTLTVDYASSEMFTPTCGFILANGSPCSCQPLHGNKRCLEHKGRRFCIPNSVSVPKEKFIYISDHLASNLDTPEILNPGEKLLPQALPNRSNDNKCDTICGVIFGNGLLCTKQPVVGRVRCEEHKGMRVNRFSSKFALEKQIPVAKQEY